jgi:hypothetical protein
MCHRKGSPADIGVYAIGNGTPTGSAQTLSTVINSGSGALPGQFYFNPSGTICYVADARNSSTGGIQKWVLSNGSFSLAYTLPTGTSNIGAYGVVADFSSPVPKVYATTAVQGLPQQQLPQRLSPILPFAVWPGHPRPALVFQQQFY